ncbi:GNAT family N-acetyltransferase [Jiella sonneratiae]|uniref:GNAT family N-acetyltransferase n=1 Tax=Jiella sonneratiae TaxID=2816856 RepID=A0ABS3J381_9HYPH|nr:GNAT family N-acetyltransferase [Jiella sonneratiae]MBO0904119.1 GNAT family N-acetyltransferase [Jiella sonneratiae]
MPLPSILPFQPDDVHGAVRLSQNEGWPHTERDWGLIASISQGFVARDGERIVGTAFATPYGDDVAMLNMIVVDAAMRGRGLGRRLVETIIEAAGERAMRLVATDAGLPLYEKLGFRESGRILQHQGEALPVDAPEGVEAIGTDQLPAIAALDREAFGADRSTLFHVLLSVGEAVALRDDRGALSGFAVCRAFGRGFVVGPVVAPDEAAAKRLIAAHLAGRAGAFARVDTPLASGLAPWLCERGLAHVGGGVAMGRGAPLKASRSGAVRTFALAAQALG